MLKWGTLFIPEFVLGTAQLGMSYGIANKSGQPSTLEAENLLTLALEKGYNWFDTAQSYGNSEAVLGTYFSHHNHHPNIITKLAPDLDPTNPDQVLHAVQHSCDTLNVSSLTGIMLHRPAWLEHWDTLKQGLNEAKAQGLVHYFGISIYTPEEMEQVLDIPEITLIQAPFNAWDPRFLNTQALEKARNSGKCCFLRSIYLQGLLLMTPTEVEQHLPEAHTLSIKWWQLCETLNKSPKTVALNYAKSFAFPLVIGMETALQMEETLEMINTAMLSTNEIQKIQETLHEFATESIVNPVNWKRR